MKVTSIGIIEVSRNQILEKLYPNTRVYGPYVSGRDGRQRVVFRETRDDGKVIKNGRSFSMSLARAEMTVHENRILERDEEVDHQDENKTNDTICNLKTMTHKENTRKHVLSKNGIIKKDTAQICQECSKEVFSSKTIEFCGVSCRSKAVIRRKREEGKPIIPPVNYHIVSENDLSEISERLKSGQSQRTISKEMGFNRATINKYSRILKTL